MHGVIAFFKRENLHDERLHLRWAALLFLGLLRKKLEAEDSEHKDGENRDDGAERSQTNGGIRNGGYPYKQIACKKSGNDRSV